VSRALCSVVIPTYNRSETVTRCIEHLADQDCAGGLQVIVVDDGSSDDTVAVLNDRPHAFADFTILTQPNAGPGAARNNGLTRTTAEYVLFINDDALLGPKAVSAHLRAHREHPKSMILGTFDFVPEFAGTPLGRILSETPHLFSYPLFSDGDELSAELGATCNLSVATDAAKRAGFDERYSFAAEDVDFALRLQDDGFVLRHVADARAYHDHLLTVQALGRTAVLRGVGGARLALKRGVRPEMLADVRRTMLREEQTRHKLDAAMETLEADLADSDRHQPLVEETYAALADIFRLGNLLGHIDEPALVEQAWRDRAAL